MERVLGTPALFATAYGNVGSSIYYALGLTAVYALGLTPLVFVVAGIVFAATAATYAEGTARFPEAGGSASFSRHAFDELVSFVAGWAQMLVYVVTVAVSAFFVPHYLSIFWEPLNTNPWDIVVGVIVIVVLVTLNVVGVQEAAKLSISLAVVDFATQVLLVIVGFALVFSPDVLVDNVHWGVAPTWSNLAIAIPVAMLAYTGRRDRLQSRRGGARSRSHRAELVQARGGSGLRDLLHAAARRALGASGDDDRRRAHDAARASSRGGRLRERPDPRRGREHRARGHPPRRSRDLRRHPRGDDPVDRDERGRHRRLAHHLLDGDLPAAARGAAAAASALQDAVAGARPVRGRRADPRDPPGRRELRRHALLARRDALVHDRARVDRPAAHAGRGRRRDPLPRAAERPDRRHCLAVVRAPRRIGDGRLVPRPRRAEPAHALGRPRLDGRRPRRLRDLPASFPARRAARGREGAARARGSAGARVPQPPRPRHRRDSRPRPPWTWPAGSPRSAARGSSR